VEADLGGAGNGRKLMNILLNLIRIFTFPGIKRSYYGEFVINEYNNFD